MNNLNMFRGEPMTDSSDLAASLKQLAAANSQLRTSIDQLVNAVKAAEKNSLERDMALFMAQSMMLRTVIDYGGLNRAHAAKYLREAHTKAKEQDNQYAVLFLKHFVQLAEGKTPEPPHPKRPDLKVVS